LLAEGGGRIAARTMAERRFLVARNLQRIHGDTLAPDELDRLVVRSFAGYARYWVESARLPGLSDEVVDEGHDVTGYEHVQRALDAGRGLILVLPHLGGWEWSAFWLARLNGVRVTAVVEPLQPPALMEWFVQFRRSLGMTIVPLGPSAGTEVLAALKRNDVVCLLADRDIGGGGVEVDFFGERTTLPAGPATLALRAGVPLCPTAVYFKGRHGHAGVVRPPLDATRTGRLRDDIARLTQAVADDLEVLVRAAPEQWHLMQPNWPSDHTALAEWRRTQG
jgi:KDO2-lipid IV(A) lauroyltransferase